MHWKWNSDITPDLPLHLGPSHISDDMVEVVMALEKVDRIAGNIIDLNYVSVRVLAINGYFNLAYMLVWRDINSSLGTELPSFNFPP